MSSSLVQLNDDLSSANNLKLTKTKLEKKSNKRKITSSVATSDDITSDNTNSDVITFSDDSYKTPPKKSSTENINNTPVVVTTTTSTCTSINENIKMESMTYNSEKNCNLDFLFDSFQQSSTNNITKSTNLTVVDVCKIYTIEEGKNILVAIAISNFYGGRNYIKDFMNKPSKLFYFAYTTQLCENKLNIPHKSHVDYLFHKNSRPVTVLSSYPRTENKYLFETMEET